MKTSDVGAETWMRARDEKGNNKTPYSIAAMSSTCQQRSRYIHGAVKWHPWDCDSIPMDTRVSNRMICKCSYNTLILW
jgi:hypothetical protein